jgi:hypothetical protein
MTSCGDAMQCFMSVLGGVLSLFIRLSAPAPTSRSRAPSRPTQRRQRCSLGNYEAMKLRARVRETWDEARRRGRWGDIS